MIINNVNRQKITNEFNNAGLFPNPILALDDTEFGGDFTFDTGADTNLIQSIIGNHNPAPQPQPEPPLTPREQELLDRIKMLEEYLEEHESALIEITEMIIGGE